MPDTLGDDYVMVRDTASFNSNLSTSPMKAPVVERGLTCTVTAQDFTCAGIDDLVDPGSSWHTVDCRG